MNNKTKEAVKVLRSGGIVIFPTDTAIGIGCRIDKEEAVKRLFEIRRRSESKPLLVLVDSVEMAEKYLLPIPIKVKKDLMDKYWPGRLTIILKSRPNAVSNIVASGTNTLGVRLPNSQKLLDLIGRVGFPIVAPSANFAGETTPFRFKDLDPKLIKSVDYIWNEKMVSGGELSTIIDCTVEPWRVIRDGAVKIQQITLLIDTSDNKKNMVGLRINGKEYRQIKNVSINKTQEILPMINRILEKHELKIRDISGIEINIGPGSFTGLRVGLAIANTLASELQVPINGINDKIILPLYK